MKSIAQAAIVASLLMIPLTSWACETPVSVCERDMGQSFGLIRAGQPVSVYIDSAADPAVQHVAKAFEADLERVGAGDSRIVTDLAKASGEAVVIGVLGQSPVIDAWIKSGKIKASDIKGEWEAFRQVVVENPTKGIRRALVIIGSDRRGAVFGTYDLSEKIGVSPWYWWADVPVAKKTDVFVTKGTRKDQPKVKYRGFFINDEEPAFGNWAREKFGGINAKMYANVFELNLRLKGNYLWPAMWGKAFNDDDPQNYVLADEMGVIIGTSHHEPMMRAQDEWHRLTPEGRGNNKWDFVTNKAALQAFWRGGIARMTKPDGRIYDSLVTIGMRGDGDEAMTEGTAIDLMEAIVADQRQTIAEVTGRPASETPQVWALYKEVQDYYEEGMKVPEDVLLLFADDNWGQNRRLPVKDIGRKGGYGVYYHFDYVGGPRNYKWLNTVQIEKVWQQMDLAYRRGANDLWIVNVGDIKPMEYPLSFFMDMAWNPEAMTLEALGDYPQAWAAKQFGAEEAPEIATLLTTYSRYAARRKPELIDAQSFALGSTAEADRVGEFESMLAEWGQLEQATLRVKADLDPAHHDAYFQLVEQPVTALSNLYSLYYGVARNQQLAAVNNPRANAFADLAEAAFARDQAITKAYHELKGGKWNHMMSQTHIGYDNWQQPETQVMPKLTRVTGSLSGKAVAMEMPRYRYDLSVSRHTETNGVIAIEAASFSRAVDGQNLKWRVIPNLGRTVSAVSAFPQGQDSTRPEDGVRLEYDVRLSKAADATLYLHMIPTLDTRGAGGVRIGVCIDDGPVQVLTFDLVPHSPAWDKAVADNALILKAVFPELSAGDHTIRVIRLDDNAVLQKLVLDTGGLTPSYLGPQP